MKFASTVTNYNLDIDIDRLWHHDRIKPRLWDGRKLNCYGQLKYDGHRITAFVDYKRILLCGRSLLGTNNNLLNLVEDLDYLPFVKNLKNLPPKTSIDFELFSKTSSDVKTKIKAKDELSVAVFAIPVFDNKVLTRDLQLVENFYEVNKNIFPGSFFAETLYVSENDTLASLLALAKQNKVEGIVIKEHHYSKWWKVKKVNTVDCIVTGLIDGEGKYSGMVGALRLGLYDCRGHSVEVGATSGFTDSQRSELGRGDIGRVVEVACQEVAAQGRLRHPRFIRFRDDKPAKQCLLSDLQEFT